MPEIDTNCVETKIPGFLQHHGTALVEVQEHMGDLTLVVQPEAIRQLIQALKTNFGFEMLLDLFAMDYEIRTQYSGALCGSLPTLFTSKKRRVRLKVFIGETNPEIDSIHDIYAAANWFEREAWDLFGITFKGHPHLTRILCHQEFVGHPLRKDYPSDGYQQLRKAIRSAGM
ncbi:NADH-quinone oxidoreductase subunit C [bacterium]|nr:NADH-quinone oxidoreductase subunit C [bacterium]